MKEITLVGGPNCGLNAGGLKRGEKTFRDIQSLTYTKTDRKDSTGRMVFTFNKVQSNYKKTKL